MNMVRKLKFYKKENKWYADLPDYIEAGGTENDCEMVAGADAWLDILSGGTDDVKLSISDDKVLAENIVLYKKDDGEGGGTYIAHEYNEQPVNVIMWLCGVTR